MAGWSAEMGWAGLVWRDMLGELPGLALLVAVPKMWFERGGVAIDSCPANKVHNGRHHPHPSATTTQREEFTRIIHPRDYLLSK